MTETGAADTGDDTVTGGGSAAVEREASGGAETADGRDDVATETGPEEVGTLKAAGGAGTADGRDNVAPETGSAEVEREASGVERDAAIGDGAEGIGPLEATVRGRRTVRKFNGKPLDKRLVIELLEAASWAPFHSRQEPWRFILFCGDGRKKFAEAMMSTLNKETKAEWGEWFEDQFCRLIPAHLLVVIPADPRQKAWEDAFSAASALIQNFQLLAWERRIGVVWKTNEYNWDPRFHRAVGVKPEERIVGTLHIGYFDRIPPAGKRMPIDQLLTCFEE